MWIFCPFSTFVEILKSEAVVELLKNMLLVMSNSGILVVEIKPDWMKPVDQDRSNSHFLDTESDVSNRNSSHPSPTMRFVASRHSLWDLTWEKVDEFLPYLKNELFGQDMDAGKERTILID